VSLASAAIPHKMRLDTKTAERQCEVTRASQLAGFDVRISVALPQSPPSHAVLPLRQITCADTLPVGQEILVTALAAEHDPPLGLPAPVTNSAFSPCSRRLS